MYSYRFKVLSFTEQGMYVLRRNVRGNVGGNVRG